ncbi:hypothetical protein WHR41_09099 [Cladosporium halotolerans]|uniref:Pentatricopeptide repeat domain-containing protein n=1 Tax=Cladosporium halotolerans TaxID=1052096 RepID=A0AB34KG72_9PEZI
MPCRPKLCQRFAAQLPHQPSSRTTTPHNSHIWISDELLSEAFNRYVRVSHTSRRYGSNVPGPLEARRRASKRRMGCAVTPANIGPPGGEFGALFGAGGTGSVEKGWSWNPPGLQPNLSPPAKNPSKVWSWDTKPPDPPPAWEEVLEIPELREDPVEASKEAFEELLETLPPTWSLGTQDVASITEFLASTANEVEARNTSRTIEWLGDRVTMQSASNAILAVIRDKIELATIVDDELLDIIKGLRHRVLWEERKSTCDRLHAIYLSLWTSLDRRSSDATNLRQAIFEEFAATAQTEQSCDRLIDLLLDFLGAANSNPKLATIFSATLIQTARYASKEGENEDPQRLSKLALALDHIPPAARKEVLDGSTRLLLKNSAQRKRAHAAKVWLRCLEANASIGQCPATMHVVYAQLPARFRMSQFGEHFRTLRSIDTVRILLNLWLPNMDPERLSSDCKDRASYRGQKKLQFGSTKFSSAKLGEVSKTFEELNSKGGKNFSPWVALLKAIIRHRVQPDSVLRDALYLCQHMYQPQRADRIFRHMLEGINGAIPTEVAVSMIQYFLSHNEPFRALRVFKEVSSVAVHHVPRLPVALAEVGYNHNGILLRLLLRQPDPVPIERRVKPTLDLTHEHIDAVHLIAYDIANAPGLKTSVAYRSVWAYYRYLQDRGAPLLPLLSRAFVTAGLMRPLEERLWIPDERLAYIVSIVERIEGRAVAAEAENLARSMRALLHDQVLSKRKAARERGWRQTTAEMAESTRFRLKGWTKRAPVPRKDRKSSVVPGREDPGRVQNIS